MDPLAHTLLGAALAKTRLGRDRPLAMPTLVLAANVADVDVAAYFWSSDIALAFRRGITHGPLGLALLPALVAVVVWLIGRRRSQHPGEIPRPAERSGGSSAAPDPDDWPHRRVAYPGPAHRPAAHAEPRQPAGGSAAATATAAAATATAGAGSPMSSLRSLLGLAYLGALTHPALDWLNTYGVRFLHPFDRRWFYGDALFIVDPWVWLVLGAGVFLSQRPDSPRRRLRSVSWAILAAVAATLLFTAADTLAGKLVWLLGAGGVAALGIAGLPATAAARRRAATASVAAFAIYLSAAIGVAIAARGVVRDAIAEPIERVMVGPLPVTPARREVVAVTAGEIRYGRLRFSPSPRFEWSGWSRPRPTPSPVLAAAMRDPSIQGFLGWARFLFVEIDQQPRHWEVHLMDARYTLERGARFGSATVRVPRQP